MSKSNRLLMKMVKASGGWENFLYETLRELCEAIDLTDSDVELCDIVDDTLEIIEAYEEQQGVEDCESISKTHNIQLTPTLKTKDLIKSTPKSVVKPEVKPEVKPRRMSIRVRVEPPLGDSSGELPIPTGCMIVNKEQLTITTSNGMELGRASDDGQIRGQDVSGHVSNNGKFRLVFKEVNLGTGVINFDVMPIPPAPIDPTSIATKVLGSSDTQVATESLVAKIAARTTERDANRAVPVDPPRPDSYHEVA